MASEKSLNPKDIISIKISKQLLYGILFFILSASVLSFLISDIRSSGKLTRVLIISCLIIASYVTGWHLKEKPIGKSIIAIGLLIYGLGLFIISDMLNLALSYADILAFWMLGAILMSFALNLKIFLYSSLVIGFLSLISYPSIIFPSFNEFNAYSGISLFLLLISSAATFFYGIYSQKQNFKFYSAFLLISACFLGLTLEVLNKTLNEPITFAPILLLVSLLTLLTAYHSKCSFILSLGMLGILSAWFLKSTQLTSSLQIKEFTIFSGIGLISLIFYSLGKAHDKNGVYKNFQKIYFGFGAFFTVALFLFFSTKKGLSYLEIMLQGNYYFDSLSFIFLFLLLFSGFILSTAYLIHKNLICKREALGLLMLCFVFLTITFFPKLNLFSGENKLSANGIALRTIFVITAAAEIGGLAYLKKIKYQNLKIKI